MKLSYRYKLLIASGIVVIISALLVFVLIMPQFGTIADLNASISDADLGVQQAQTLLARRQESKARAAETEALRLRLANQIPESPELPTLIVELQDTINAAGLQFASVAPNLPAQVVDQPYSAIPVAVIVRGTWQDTVDLLQRLRSLTRQVRILSFVVARIDAAEDEKDAPNTVETALGLEFYTMPAEVAAPQVPPPPDPASQ